MTVAVVLAIGPLFLAAGAAAVTAALVGMAADADLVTGDAPGQVLIRSDAGGRSR